MASIHIAVDTSPFLVLIENLNQSLPKLSDEVREHLLGLFNVPSELVRCESHPAPAGTGLVIVLKPSDRLLDLVSAIGAT
jgi:hypothetical protein